MKPSFLYVLEIQGDKLAADVMLNGASVFRDIRGGSILSQMKLNPYIVEGKNELEVWLGPPPGQEVASDAFFKVLVLAGEHGKEPGDDGILLNFTWNEADHPLAPQGWTRVLAEPILARESFGRWAWQDATPFTPADRPDVEAVVMETHRALEARDAAALQALMMIKIDELARALDVPAAELEADQRDYFQSYFTKDDWRMAPIDPATLDVVPGANGRLVKVRDLDGGPPLRGVGGGKPFGLGITVSRLKDGYRIVR